MLNTDSESRYDVTELRLSLWMRGPVSPLTPYTHTKILAEDCLPLSSLTSWGSFSSHLNTTNTLLPPPPLPVVDSRPAGLTDDSVREQPTSVCQKSKKESRRGKDSSHTSIKSKISSAGKKLVHSLLQRPSPSRTHPFESAV